MSQTQELIQLVNTNHAAIVAQLQAEANQIAELKARLTGIEQEIVRRPGGGMPSTRASIGTDVINSAEFKAFAEKGIHRGRLQINIKNMITTAPDSAGALIPPDFRTGPAMLPRRRLTIRDLLAPGTTKSSSVEYPRQTVRDLNASVVTEGGRKPESNFDFELVTANVRTIAHWTKASVQILADAPQLRSTVDGELRYGLQTVEEDEFLFGDGAGQHLLGIVPQASVFVRPFLVESENRLDILLQAITQAEDEGMLPVTGIVVNNIDLRGLQGIKDLNGQYMMSGGPMAGDGINRVWSTPIVGTASMPRGEFLVGAFQDGAQIFDREEANVQIATENEDDFIHNLCVVRAEKRLTMTVRRPQAFISGQFPLTT